MSINFFRLFIALGVSGIAAYGLYENYGGENQALLSICSFITLSIVTTISLAITFDLPRTSVNLKLISGLFSCIILAVNIGFSFFDFSRIIYIITSSIIILSYALLINLVYEAKQ